VWIGFDSAGEWLGLRSPIDIKVPEETSSRERLFRKLLEMNERLAIGKVVLSEGQLGAGVEIDSDFLNKDNLDLGLSQFG